jgi:DNA-binding transcriptional MocR family regulator
MVDLDRTAPVPLHRQLYESLRLQILDGRLPPRTRLPATHQLAEDLGVSRNTVNAACDALLAEGYLDALTPGRLHRPWLPRDAPAPDAPALCHGVDFPQLSVHYWHSAPRQGMLLGYAGIRPEQARLGVERLRAAFEELEGARSGATVRFAAP